MASFAVLPDIKSVGVTGDERTYTHTVAIRAITSEDGMTGDWARLPHDLLEHISTRITDEVECVNRIVYDITSKPRLQSVGIANKNPATLYFIGLAGFAYC